MGEGKRRKQWQQQDPELELVQKMRQAGGGLYRVTVFTMEQLTRAALKLDTPEAKYLPVETMRALMGLPEIAKEIQSKNGMVCACCRDERFKDDLPAPGGYVLVEAGKVATISPVCDKCVERPDVMTVITERVHQGDVHLVHPEIGHA